jgi:hypothetical protein
VIERDQAVDSYYAQLFPELVGVMMADPGDVHRATRLQSIACRPSGDVVAVVWYAGSEIDWLAQTLQSSEPEMRQRCGDRRHEDCNAATQIRVILCKPIERAPGTQLASIEDLRERFIAP